MRTLAIWNLLLLGFGIIFSPLRAEGDDKPVGGIDAVDGPNVRVMRHADGSKTVFTRSPNNQVVTKKTFSAAGTLVLVTIYRTDANGNPTHCDIKDPHGTRLYKVRYGYRKPDGQLVKEEMFDCRVRRTYPNDPKTEMPVQVVHYFIDAQGKRSTPVVINTLPGKTFEEVYGASSTAMPPNTFSQPAPARGR